MASIFSDERALYGGFKSTGATDIDVIHTTKQTLLFVSMPFNVASWIMIICGLLLCLTLIGIPIGVILLAVGIFLRTKISSYKKALDKAHDKYVVDVKSM